MRGVTPQLLFGSDSNRNGQVDPHELLQENNSTTGDPRGWSAYLTLYSVEWNISPEGQPKVYLNMNDLNGAGRCAGTAGFPDEWITFIVAYRQSGSGGGGRATIIGGGNAAGGNAANQSTGGELNMNLPPTTPIGSVLDLIGAQKCNINSPAPGGHHAHFAVHRNGSGVVYDQADGLCDRQSRRHDSRANQHQPVLGDRPSRDSRNAFGGG